MRSAEIELKPMTVDDQWFHVFINGENTDYVFHLSDLGELRDITTAYRLRRAMKRAMGESTYLEH